VALSAVNPDCDAVSYTPVGAGTTEFLLSDAQGARSLFLCARDRAGNVDRAGAIRPTPSCWTRSPRRRAR
jgi:hypothetical protein